MELANKSENVTVFNLKLTFCVVDHDWPVISELFVHGSVRMAFQKRQQKRKQASGCVGDLAVPQHMRHVLIVMCWRC